MLYFFQKKLETLVNAGKLDFKKKSKKNEISLKVGIVGTVFNADVCTIKFKYL